MHEGICVLDIVLAFASLFISLSFAVMLHEMAHAVAGRLAGLNIRRIRIGAEPFFIKFRFSHIDIQIGQPPGDGCVDIYTPLRRSKYRRLVFVAAGPVMDIVWFAMLWSLLKAYHGQPFANSVLIPALAVQAYMIISNLIPRWVHLYGQSLPTDTLALWHLICEKEDPYAYHSANYAIALERYQVGDAPAFVVRPQAERIAFHYFALIWGRQQNDKEPLLALRDELKQELSSAEEVMAIDTIVSHAITRLPDRTEADLDTLTARALAMAPDIRTLQFTRGSVLARMGRHQEALALLDVRDDDTDSDRGITLGFRALAQFHAGNIEEARAEMDKAIAIMRQMQSPSWIGNDVLMLIGSMIRYWPKPPAEPNGGPGGAELENA